MKLKEIGSGRIHCCYCHREFSDQQALNEHWVAKWEEGPSQCDEDQYDDFQYGGPSWDGCNLCHDFYCDESNPVQLRLDPDGDGRWFDKNRLWLGPIWRVTHRIGALSVSRREVTGYFATEEAAKECAAQYKPNNWKYGGRFFLWRESLEESCELPPVVGMASGS